MSEWNKQSTETWNNAWSSENTGSSISSIATGLSGVFKAGMANAQIKDTEAEKAEAKAVGATQFSSGSYDNLLEQFDANNLARKNYTRKELRGLNGWQMAGNTLSGIASGATAGASVGGPWGAVAGAVVGLGASLGGIFTGNAKADGAANHLNYLGIENNKTYLTNFINSVSNTHDMKFNSSLLNMSNAAYGGPLFNHSENFDNGIIFINEGGTHEQNHFGGVPVGVDQEGIPNLVEEGEVIWNDYVFSNRLKPTKKQLANNGYSDKYQDLTFAKLAEKLQDSERVNDTISKESLNDSMFDLIGMQEEVRDKKVKRDVNKFSNGGNKDNLLRYASPLVNFGTFLSNLKKPDYSNANRIEKAAQQIPGGSFTPLGNFINLEPLDRNYYLNPLLSTSRSNARNIQNYAVNAGQAMSGLLTNNYNTQRNIGATLMQMKQENMNRELQEATFNRGTHQVNTQMGLQALAMDQQRANNILNATIQAANMRNSLDAMRSQALSASLSGIAEDLGGIGRENMDRQTIKGLIDSGVLEDYLKAAGYSKNSAKNGGLLTKRKRRIR